ncbi:MAG: HAD-IA family hydrolase [Gemmatimonas sp.]|jgi:pyrophosphatase PpaX|uniref:HAD family hydrolase n=1 Tax=Gemmatimonas sp. TaxID=1962908 RepID=UPI0025BA56C3|nr:HAD-IA family hydrolase [Gemmatimonas sp.]MCE2952544.1 HAD-IA family hydrolase [Gemmatimonas sp.]
MPRPALLFDLDGTLIDSIGLLLECMQYAFAGRDRAPTTAEWVAGIGTPLRTQLSTWCTDAADVEAMVGRYRDYQDLHLERLTTPFPDVLATLRWAREAGYPTAIVTSKGKGMTRRSLDHVGLGDSFDAVVTFEETTRHKPLPDPVWLALERLGANANAALFVGDSPHDMHAGRAAGVKTAAALWGPFTRDELAVAAPDYWLSGFGELRNLLRDFQ